jgi:hypothetical protein
MSIRSGLNLFVLLAVSAFQMIAADPSGKWVMETEGRDGQKRTQTMMLKADGEKLTGTISGRMGDRPISDGRISGDDISFSMTIEMGGETRKLLYTGKIEGDDLKLNMKSEGGEFSRDMVAKRATS